MKHRMKKIMSMLVIGVSVLSLSACAGQKEDTENKGDELLSQQAVTTAEGLTDTIVVLTDEEIESYKESTDDFTVQAMEAWETSKEELGSFVSSEEAQVEYDDEVYTVTIPSEFEKADANFVYTFDETGVPTGMSMDIQYSLAVNMQRAALNTVMGLGVVFIMLIFLSFVISLFPFVPKLLDKKSKETEEDLTPVTVPAQETAEAAEEEVQDDTELVAVIAAAIAAAEGTSPDGFVVRSIRKVNRKKW